LTTGARSPHRAARCGHLPAFGPRNIITVDDDGPGIQPDAIEKIFERFYTDRPQQNFGQNSGLGLSISKQIVEAHDGRLSAQNRVAPREPCHDATVTMRFARSRFLARVSWFGCRRCRRW